MNVLSSGERGGPCRLWWLAVVALVGLAVPAGKAWATEVHDSIESPPPSASSSSSLKDSVLSFLEEEVGRFVSKTRIRGPRPQYTYTHRPDGRLKRDLIRVLGHWGGGNASDRSNVYDNRNRVKARITADGTANPPEVDYEYDAEGRLFKVTDELRNTTVYGYDPLGRLLTTTDATGKVVERRAYDLAGQLLRVTDALGNTTLRDYDPLGRLATITRPDGSQITFTYDAAGRLLKVQLAPGSAHQFGYDAAGRQTSHTDPNGLTSQATLDGNGNATLRTDPDAAGPITIAYQYDKLNRPTSMTAPDGTTRFAYDDTTPAVTVTLPDGTVITRTYDRAGKLTREAVGVHHTDYGYDTFGRLVTLAQDGLLLTKYGYDVMDRVSTITDARTARAITIGYDAASRPVRVGLTNGTVKSVTYGSRGEIASIVYTSARGSPLLSRFYSYDVALNVTQVSDALGQLESYTYDTRQRIKSATYRGGGFETFEYDANSNITRHTTNLSSETFLYDPADELLSVSSTDPTKAETLAYDQRGNLRGLTQGTVSTVYHWDSYNRLTQVDVNGVPVVRYGYRDDGLRFKVEFPIGTSRFTTWANGNPLVETDAFGVLTRFFLSGQGLDEVYEGQGASGTTTAEVPLVDQQGSVLAVSDLTGSITRQSAYQGYGALRAGSAPQGFLPFGHHGAMWDPAAGMYYHRARYRNASLLRWVSRDPIGFGGGWNLYGYGANSPLLLRDPFGLAGEKNGSPWWLSQNLQDLYIVVRDPNLLNQGFAQQWARNPMQDFRQGGRTATQVTAAVTAGVAASPLGPEASAISAGAASQAGGDIFDALMSGRPRISSPYDYLASMGAFLLLDDLLAVYGPFQGPMQCNGGGGGGGGGDSVPQYIWRGVHVDHPAIEAARQGIVIPADATSSLSAAEHNLGGLSSKSPFTSWTRNEALARYYAKRSGPGGVLLRVPVGSPPPDATWSWEVSQDAWMEDEVLMRGIRTNVEVLEP